MSQRIAYSAVPTDEEAAQARDVQESVHEPDFTGDSNSSSTTRKAVVDKVNAYIQSICWIAAAVFVVYYADIWRVIKTDSRVNRIFFNGGIFCLTEMLGIFVYAMLWIPFVDKQKVVDYQIYCPRAVYAFLIGSLASFLCFLIALWPVWRFVTIIILTVLYMASVFIPNFFPSFC
eukprot:TRINITY_DN8763_c0_g1_i1.p1 TRINITY_DN8763_c0_g1~~TRINITY_DN8763_c0_g1_i1.p1  ORF type:complete len:175 (+),score=29.00 TRINITY_DN8763_c0_g1_i1:112-636(+)